MKEFLIFLKGLACVLAGIVGGITAIGAISTKQPIFVISGILFLAVWIYLFITYMNNNYKNKAD